MRDLQHIIALIAILVGMITNSLTLIAGAIFIMLDMIYSELKKLNEQ